MNKLLPLLGAFLLVVGCGGADSEEPGSDVPVGPEESAVLPAPSPGPGAPGSSLPPGVETTPPSTGTPPGTPPGTPAAGAFAGAAAYTAKLGPSTIDTSGKGNGHLSFNAAGNPAGKACLSCHDGTGKSGAPAFLFAGTVYADKAATKPAVKAEVRILGADGKGLSAYTDANGNFFFREGAGQMAVPAVAGARNAAGAESMLNKINDANCNQCHSAGSILSL